MLKRIQQLAQKIHLSLAGNDKRMKDAEILLRHTAFRLNEMLHGSSFEDRPLVEAALTDVNQAQSEAMMQVFQQIETAHSPSYQSTPPYCMPLLPPFSLRHSLCLNKSAGGNAAMRCLSAILLCLLGCLRRSAAQKQKREPLTEAQVEKIAEAGIDPNARVVLYTQYLNEHADAIKSPDQPQGLRRPRQPAERCARGLHRPDG